MPLFPLTVLSTGLDGDGFEYVSPMLRSLPSSRFTAGSEYASLMYGLLARERRSPTSFALTVCLRRQLASAGRYGGGGSGGGGSGGGGSGGGGGALVMVGVMLVATVVVIVTTDDSTHPPTYPPSHLPTHPLVNPPSPLRRAFLISN